MIADATKYPTLIYERGVVFFLNHVTAMWGGLSENIFSSLKRMEREPGHMHPPLTLRLMMYEVLNPLSLSLSLSLYIYKLCCIHTRTTSCFVFLGALTE